VSTVAEASPGLRAMSGACAVVDRSESGKLALTGPEAKTFLQGQVTNDVEALVPGRGVYAAFLTNKGKMLGDLRVVDTGDELLLLCERVALPALFDLIRRFKIGHRVELHKRTLERGLLSLIGPAARDVAGAAALADEEHANATGEILDVPVVLVATDRGVDVICPSEDTARIAAELEARGAVPASEDDAEIARVESGRPRYGVDLDESVIPQEAGLNDRAVSFSKGCYVGQETVARLFYKGRPNRHLRGLELSAPVEPGTPLTLGEKQVGVVGSSVVSPRLGSIGLALVRREAEPGTRLSAGHASATVVALPFG
jgi:tRNA-modifying protein YgfZ